MYLSGYKYRLVRDQILHKAHRASWNLITWPTGIYIPIDTLKWYLKPVLHPAVLASTCCLRAKMAKSQGTRKVHVRWFYPADHTQRLAEEFWLHHNFLRAPCDYRFAVSPQGTCTKKERYTCDLLALVASLKWQERGEKWHPNNYGTRICVSLSTCVPRVKWVQLKWLVLVKCMCRLACKRDSRGKSALYSTWY
jgi:hypothetical protein